MVDSGLKSSLARLPTAPEPLVWRNGELRLLDQTRLPSQVVYQHPHSAAEVAQAIRLLVVRGAPLIGVAAAFGLVLEARRKRSLHDLMHAAAGLRSVRPTAVNLSWAVDRLLRVILSARVDRNLPDRLEAEARAILREEANRSLRIAQFGLRVLQGGSRIMTICNAGRLAAPGLGTALAPIYLAHAQGQRVTVYVPETRPLLQGARLTAYELSAVGIDVVVLCDSMLATALPEIDLVLVGADRIARNGDFANKIGTYQLALLAQVFGKPFYPVAPISTFDPTAQSGKDIPIEQRSPAELSHWGRRRITPEGIRIHNPAFDITPARLVTGIITDQGIVRPPLKKSIARLVVPGP